MRNFLIGDGNAEGNFQDRLTLIVSMDRNVSGSRICVVLFGVERYLYYLAILVIGLSLRGSEEAAIANDVLYVNAVYMTWRDLQALR